MAKKPNSLLDAIAAEPTNTGLTERIRAYLIHQKKGAGISALADRFDCSPSRIKSALDQLGESFIQLHVVGEEVSIKRELPTSAPTVIDTSRLKGKAMRFGCTGDNHLGSRYERMDVLNALFDLWADQGVDTVLQAGNMIDGEAHFNKFDIYVRGIEEQCDNFVEKWPQRKGITTKFITGDDHEGWYIQREGVNVGRLLEDKARRAGRDDLEFLGHMEHDLELKAEHGSAIMRIIHGGGGTAYAVSYNDQKQVESYQGGEKPNVLITGHFHKFNYGYPREVHAIQVGTTEDQTPFMRKRRLQAMVGGVTLEMTQSPDGLLHGVAARWWPFYDRSFYASKTWRYGWPKLGGRK